jgi:hypothetical protein
MIRINNIYKACMQGHKLLATRETCAHCDGFTETEFLEAIRGKNVKSMTYKKKEARALVEYRGNWYPLDRADVVNGLDPSRKVPDGWYIYYIRFTYQSQEVYKIGVSQKPWDRAASFNGTILWCEYVGTYDQAVVEEAKVINRYAAYRVNLRGLRHGGGTECFTKNVLLK